VKKKKSDITPTLPFTEFDFLQSYRESFAKSELGRIHSQLPLKELAAEYTNLSHKSKRGNKPLFSGEGEIVLMFLKSYTGLSDDVGLAAFVIPRILSTASYWYLFSITV